MYLYLYLYLYLYDRVTGRRYGQLGGTRQQGRGRSRVYGLILNLGNCSSRESALSDLPQDTPVTVAGLLSVFKTIMSFEIVNLNAQPHKYPRWYCHIVETEISKTTNGSPCILVVSSVCEESLFCPYTSLIKWCPEESYGGTYTGCCTFEN